MGGIYIHIPFCKQACYYCNFHFSTNLGNTAAMSAALCKDIILRQNYLLQREVGSIYFGGGTPSVLSIPELSAIMDTLRTTFVILPGAEITLECNPDDISADFLTALKSLGINRLSLGVQSFFEEDLKYMHRAHNAADAIESIQTIRACGFENFTIDLIYGSETTSDAMWAKNVEMVRELNIPHVSAYCMTIEEKTVFGTWLKQNKIKPVDEEKSTRQYAYLMDAMEEAGYHHYEISNFSKPGLEAVHNSNYWRGVPYLGIGPSAHSYNGKQRSWVQSNNAHYLKAIDEGFVPIESEQLSDTDQYNEYVMTRLRTSWGIDMAYLRSVFGEAAAAHFEEQSRSENIAPFLDREGSVWTLNRQGKFLADRIAASFFQ
ncbi:MAG: radical SAM family heme chaperone HemW [Saprospiraceae bacterium]|nr:radical SAM family heme chaperone HemW [Saprospiraceae bacterium]